MADFGDEFGAELKQSTVSLVQFAFSEWRMSRMYQPRTSEEYQQDVADGKRSADLKNDQLKDAIANGKNSVYDFTDGQAQDFQFDLSAFEGKDLEIAKSALDKTLSEAGIDPSRLVAQMKDIIDENGKLIGTEPTGRYNLTFQDSEAKALDFVTDHYYDNILLDPRIQESMGLEEISLHFENLASTPVESREAVVKAFINATNLAPEKIDIAHNEKGDIIGVSINVPAKDARSLKDRLEQLWDEYKSKNNIGRNWPKKLTCSTESATVRIEAVVEKNEEAEAISKALVADGLLDARVKVDSAGKIMIETSVDTFSQVEGTLGKYKARKMFDKARNQAIAAPSKGAITPWVERQKHAVDAADSLKKLGQQVINPEIALREQLPFVPKVGSR